MKSKHLTIQEIEEIIKLNNPDGLIGAIETSSFEFRELPYQTNNKHSVTSKEKSRMELLKDFSSIANSGGGYILIGLKPSIDLSKFNLEYVEKVIGVKTDEIAWQSWLDTLSTFLFPAVRKAYVTHGFIGESNQVFWLRVPDSKKIGCYPFILSKDQWVTEENTLLKGNLYGVYFRDGAENKQILSAEKIQGLITRSLEEPNTPMVSTAEINAKLDQIIALQGSTNDSIGDLDLKKNEVVHLIKKRLDQDSDIFYLIAIPNESSNISSEEFWSKGEDSLYHIINNPPTLRKMGWDLNTASIEYPEPKGDAWESTNGNRKIIRVDKQGIISVGGTIQEFLDWGMKNEHQEEHKINAFALVEFIYSYFSFLRIYFGKYQKDSTQFRIFGGFVIRTKKDYQLEFSIDTAGIGIHFRHESLKLSKKEWDFGTYDKALINQPTRLAAVTVFEIYASGFSLVDEHPPYLKKVDNIWIVDTEKYLKQG